MAQVTVTTRVSSETTSGVVMVFTQADSSSAQAVVPVSAAGVPVAMTTPSGASALYVNLRSSTGTEITSTAQG